MDKQMKGRLRVCVCVCYCSLLASVNLKVSAYEVMGRLLLTNGGSDRYTVTPLNLSNNTHTHFSQTYYTYVSV